MIVTYDLAACHATVEDAGDMTRLQLTVYGEAAFFADALPGVLLVGYEPAEGEELVVSLVEVAPKRWAVAARIA